MAKILCNETTDNDQFGNQAIERYLYSFNISFFSPPQNPNSQPQAPLFARLLFKLAAISADTYYIV